VNDAEQALLIWKRKRGFPFVGGREKTKTKSTTENPQFLWRQMNN